MFLILILHSTRQFSLWTVICPNLLTQNFLGHAAVFKQEQHLINRVKSSSNIDLVNFIFTCNNRSSHLALHYKMNFINIPQLLIRTRFCMTQDTTHYLFLLICKSPEEAINNPWAKWTIDMSSFVNARARPQSTQQ